MQGNAVSWASAGQLALEAQKSTPFAAQQAAETAAKAAMEHGMKTVSVYVKVQVQGVKWQYVRYRLQDLRLT